jgi:peroxiredoxin
MTEEDGKSDRPWKSYDYDTLADDLNEVITQLKRKSCTSWFFDGGGEISR